VSGRSIDSVDETAQRRDSRERSEVEMTQLPVECGEHEHGETEQVNVRVKRGLKSGRHVKQRTRLNVD
jgi:hypothetical protein